VVLWYGTIETESREQGENMSKTEFQIAVQSYAGWVGLKWPTTGDMVRAHDPALAEMIDRYHASAEAVFAYCKGRTEGK
jgi:hypothetical protein